MTEFVQWSEAVKQEMLQIGLSEQDVSELSQDNEHVLKSDFERGISAKSCAAKFGSFVAALPPFDNLSK